MQFTFPSIILYASSSQGYEADRSVTPSSSISASEQSWQFGALVPGLSHSEVQSIRSNTHSIVIAKLREESMVTVADILSNCNNPNTRKVLEKAYALSGFKYDHESVIASRNLGTAISVNYSPAMLRLLDMR